MFAPHNLIRDAPFTKLDLITCRNLLIYFQPQAQKTVLSLFHFALKPGGLLFLGSSESPGGAARRVRHDRRAREDLPQAARRRTAARSEAAAAARRHAAAVAAAARPRSRGVSPQLLAVYDRLLDRFMPPSFLVDEHGQLVDSFGGAETLLKVKRAAADAEPARDARRRAADGRVRRAASRAPRCSRASAIAASTVPGRWPAATRWWPSRSATRTASSRTSDLARRSTRRRSAACSCRRSPTCRARGSMPRRDGRSSPGCRAISMRALEDELRYTQGESAGRRSRSSRRANEELQATNEELVASNEELQSTNEELHSVNEELYTVNAEYQKKIAELQELNDDIEHLLERHRRRHDVPRSRAVHPQVHAADRRDLPRHPARHRPAARAPSRTTSSTRR